MEKNIHACPYPECSASHVLSEIKEANAMYRQEIRDQLGTINDAIQSMTRVLSEYMKNNALVEQSIVFLRESEVRNEKDHDLLRKKIDAIEGRGYAWLWDLVKIAAAAGTGVLVGKHI